MSHIYIGNDNIIWLLGLTNMVTGNAITNATVTAQIKDRAGTNVGSIIAFSSHGSIAIEGTTYPSGNYRGVVEEDVDLDRGGHYVVHIDADAGGDLKAHWEVPLHAMVRTF